MYKKILNEMWGDIPMKVRYVIFFVIGFGLCAIFWITSCASISKAIKDIPQDSYIEEFAECVIESYLDMPKGSIDITPRSIEE